MSSASDDVQNEKASFNVDGDCPLCHHEEETVDHYLNIVMWQNL